MTSPVIQQARELAARLADTALERDRAGALPFAEVDWLRQSGLLKLLVSESAGGAGRKWSEAIGATRIVAAADASIAHLLGYHYLNYLSAVLVATPAQKTEIDHGLVAENWFLGDSVNPLDPGLVVVRDGDSIRLDGRRSFATGAAVADRILLTFRVGERGAITLLPRDRQGVRSNDDWDNLGQRLSASGSLSFDNVVIGTDEILGLGLESPAPEPKPSPMSAMIQTTLSVIQLGLAEGALAAGAAYTGAHSRAWFKSGVTRAVDDPLIAAPYGLLSARIAAAGALADATALALDRALDQGTALTAEERGATAIQAFQLKIVTGEVALETTSRIYELMGARSSANRFGFDRFWRDARTITLHDPAAYKALETGRFVLTGELPEPTTYS